MSPIDGRQALGWPGSLFGQGKPRDVASVLDESAQDVQPLVAMLALGHRARTCLASAYRFDHSLADLLPRAIAALDRFCPRCTALPRRSSGRDRRTVVRGRSAAIGH